MSDRSFAARHPPAGAVLAEGPLQTWPVSPRTGDWVTFARTAPVGALARGTLHRLEHEARILRGLDTPHLSRFVEMGLEGDLAYVSAAVATKIPRTLRDALRDGPLSAPTALAVARALLHALATLHEAGIVHRDVRPQTTVWGSAPQLLCFPLTVHDLAQPSLRDPAWTDVLPYLSPELAGLLHGGVDSRSDLYAVGAVLYECLTGRPPFAAADVRTLLRQPVVAPLPSLGDAAPIMLERFTGRLLAKSPRDRYQTARGALADLERLTDELEAGRDDAMFALGLHDRRTVLGEPDLVGREAEIETLLATLQSAPSLTTVEADSGGGKSHLLREAAVRASGSGARVVAVRAERGQTETPFPLLREIVCALQAEHDPSVTRALEAHAPALRPLSEAPSSRRDEGGGGSHDAGEGSGYNEGASGSRAVVRAVLLLLEAAASERPLMMLIDDAQWADDSVMLLLRACAEACAPITVVVAFRADEVAPDAPLRRLPGATSLPLGPLSADAMWEAVGSMAGPLPASLRPLIDQCDGAPFVAVELLRGLADSGALTHDGTVWTLRDDALPQVSSRAADMLLTRLERLAPDTLTVLEACAPLGSVFTLDDALRACDGPTGALLPALEDARRHGVVWSEAIPGRFAFVHDRLREAVLARMQSDARRAVHARVAAACARDAPHDCYALAWHLAQADQAEQAHPHARRAATDAHARGALDVAETYYRIALHGAPDHHAVANVVEGLAEVLLRRGRYEEAAGMWRRAVVLAADLQGRARALGRLGEIGLKTGGADAFAHLEEALALLGHPVPAGNAHLLLAIGREVLIQCLHSMLPERFLAQRDPSLGARDLLAGTLLDRLKQLSGLESRFALTFWSHVRALNTVERYPPTRQLGWAWIEHGEVLTLLAWFSRAQRYLERGMTLEQTRRDPLQVARGLSRKGFYHYRRGELTQASETFTQALEGFVETSEEFWEIEIVRFYLARAEFLRGRTAWATATARKVHEALRAGGDPSVGNAALADVVRNTGGQVTPAEIGAPADDLPPLANAEILLAQGLWLLGQGEAVEAAQRFARASATTGRFEPPSHYVTRRCWEATAWRFAASRLPVGAGALRAAYLKRAREAANRALRSAVRARVHLPHALWESAVLAAEQGREERARRLFRDALKTAVEQENMYGFAWALYERGRVGAALGWPDAEKNQADADWAFRSIGLDPAPLTSYRLPVPLSSSRPLPLALEDRFLGLIEAGRAIVSATRRDDILEAVRKAVADLLRPQVSRIVSAPAPSHETGSLLALPLLVRGVPAVWVEAVHDEVEDYFQGEERMVAAHLAALAGAALENADRFDALNALTRAAEAQSAQLQASLDEKEVMLREIHHRVKNNLQVIVSLLNLQANHAHDTRVTKAFAEAANRIRSMSLIHEFVSVSDDVSEIHMDRYLRTLVEHIVFSHGRSDVQVRFALAPVHLPISLAVDCGLIVNELVSNALEHAFPGDRGGTLTVSLHEGETGMQLVVADDGVGYDPNARPSLGTTLVRLLSEKVGTLTLQTAAGTRAQIDLR